MATSVEDIVNQSLRRIGYTTPIGYIYEGSMPARVALELYGQTRDAVLAMQDWAFARQEENLGTALTKPGDYTPATWPPTPWLYAYGYPAQCIKVRYVKPATATPWPNFDPRPQQFSEFNTATVRALLCNVNPVTAVITGQITDMTQWEPNFTELLVEQLARRFAVALKGSLDLLKAEVELADEALSSAAQSQINIPPGVAMPEARK